MQEDVHSLRVEINLGFGVWCWCWRKEILYKIGKIQLVIWKIKAVCMNIRSFSLFFSLLQITAVDKQLLVLCTYPAFFLALCVFVSWEIAEWKDSGLSPGGEGWKMIDDQVLKS